MRMVTIVVPSGVLCIAPLAPAVGFEPTTNRLTADRSTTELRWIFCVAREGVNFAQPSRRGKCFGCGGGI